MFSGTENRIFDCRTCKRKEDKRSIIWGQKPDLDFWSKVQGDMFMSEKLEDFESVYSEHLSGNHTPPQTDRLGRGVGIHVLNKNKEKRQGRHFHDNERGETNSLSPRVRKTCNGSPKDSPSPERSRAGGLHGRYPGQSPISGRNGRDTQHDIHSSSQKFKTGRIIGKSNSSSPVNERNLRIVSPKEGVHRRKSHRDTFQGKMGSRESRYHRNNSPGSVSPSNVRRDPSWREREGGRFHRDHIRSPSRKVKMKGSSYGERFSREYQSPSPNRSAVSSYRSTPRSPASSCGERSADLDPELLEEMLKKKMTSGRFWKFMRGSLETHPRKKRERQRDCRTCEGHEHKMETILQDAEKRDRLEWTKKMLYRVDGVNVNMANQRTPHPCSAHNQKIEESLKYIKSPRRIHDYEDGTWYIVDGVQGKGKRSDERVLENESRTVRIKEKVTQITDTKKSRKSPDNGSNPTAEIPTPTILKHSEKMRFSSPERVLRNPKLGYPKSGGNQKVVNLGNNFGRNIPVKPEDNLMGKFIANVKTDVITQQGHEVIDNRQASEEKSKTNLEKENSQDNEHLNQQKKPQNFKRSVSTVKREVTKPDHTSQTRNYSSAPRSSRVLQTGNCKRFVHQEEACKKILLDHEESRGPYLTREQLSTKARARSRTNSPCKRYVDHEDKSSSFLQRKHQEEVTLQEQAKEWRSPRAKHVQSVMKQLRDVRMAPSSCKRFLSNDRKSEEYLQKKYEQEYYLEKSVKESRSPVDEHVKSVRQRAKGVPPACNRFEQEERNQKASPKRPMSRTTPAKLRHQNMPGGHQGESSQSCDRSQKHHERSERFFDELESSRESTPGSRGFWDLEEELRNHEMYREFKRRRDEDICSKSKEHDRSYSSTKEPGQKITKLRNSSNKYGNSQGSPKNKRYEKIYRI